MRQTYDVTGGPDMGRENLPSLRAEMVRQNLDAFYVPHEDEYQNEYLPAQAERLAWVSGFTGSAGAAMIFADSAHIFVDGRYTLQVRSQTAPELFAYQDLINPGPFGWLKDQDVSGKRIGYDPALISPNALSRLKLASQTVKAELVALDHNPIDQAWADRPPAPMAKIRPHGIEFSGESAQSKMERLGQHIAMQQGDAALITSPASIAWLFNIRGGDVACTPLPLGRAILRKDGSAELFIDKHKTDDALIQHLGNQVQLRDIGELADGLTALKGQCIGVDYNQTSTWFVDRLEKSGARTLSMSDPCLVARACKNGTEIGGAERAHARDAVPLIRFLKWLSEDAQSGEVSEIEAAQKLESLREETGALQDLSFETISAAGPNGAHCHYRVNTDSNRKLERGTLYLVDSGAQYLDGTTDVTRTVAIGMPSMEMKDRYTRVLKGHIALACVRFPEGTTGTHLDALARMYLWQAGLDYEHGTGHGVGSYLGVHEGPQRIAKAWNDQPLLPGMILSNEPGYYKAEAFGIRIENLQYVTEAKMIEGGDQPMLGFQCLTLAPLASDLILPELLSQDELDWVNAYHIRVLDEITPRLAPEDAQWLVRACAKI